MPKEPVESLTASIGEVISFAQVGAKLCLCRLDINRNLVSVIVSIASCLYLSPCDALLNLTSTWSELPRESRASSRSPSPKRRRYARSSPNRDSRRRRRSRSSSRGSGAYDRRRHSRSRSRSEDRGHSSKRRRQYDSRSRSRSRSRSVSYGRSRSARSYSRSRSRSRSSSRGRRDNRVWPKLLAGEEEEKFITTVAKKVLEHGERFERTLREREKSNPKFSFLIESDVRNIT